MNEGAPKAKYENLVAHRMALRSPREIADEFHRRTGLRMSESLVYHYLKRAEMKVRKALEALEEQNDAR